jgi:hypothetical protein
MSQENVEVVRSGAEAFTREAGTRAGIYGYSIAPRRASQAPSQRLHSSKQIRQCSWCWTWRSHRIAPPSLARSGGRKSDPRHYPWDACGRLAAEWAECLPCISPRTVPRAPSAGSACSPLGHFGDLWSWRGTQRAALIGSIAAIVPGARWTQMVRPREEPGRGDRDIARQHEDRVRSFRRGAPCPPGRRRLPAPGFRPAHARPWRPDWPSASPSSTTTAGGAATPVTRRCTRSTASSRISRFCSKRQAAPLASTGARPGETSPCERRARGCR